MNRDRKMSRVLFLIAFFIGGIPTAKAQQKELSEKAQLYILRLIYKEARAREMATYCQMWAERFRVAYKYGDVEWQKFLKNAPRHIGTGRPYDVEYDEQADDYDRVAEVMNKKIGAAIRGWCGKGMGLQISYDGKMSCTSFGSLARTRTTSRIHQNLPSR